MGCAGQDKELGTWLKSRIEAANGRLHHNVFAIVPVNKLARIAWAVLAYRRAFFELTRNDDAASDPLEARSRVISAPSCKRKNRQGGPRRLLQLRFAGRG